MAPRGPDLLRRVVRAARVDGPPEDDPVLFWQEVHEIAGGQMPAFHAAVRDVWRPLIEDGGHARLLWFWDHAHGTGPSYHAVSLAAVRDWAAWATLVERRTASEAARTWRREAGALRRRVTGKVLLPVAWSPLQEVDLGAPDLPLARDPDSALHLHDTGWPYPGRLDDYVEALGRIFHPQTRRSGMIAIEGCWRTCPGNGIEDEVVLLQRILDWPVYTRLLAGGESTAQRGGWMEEGLEYRDRWESRFLRLAPWSPRR